MPPFPIRSFRVTERRSETFETFTIVLEPADGEPIFAFKAGQFVMVHLANPDGTPWAKAAYSIATAPCESMKSFELGIKIHGDFTKRLSELKEGDTIGIQGPYGAFFLKEDADRIVFFAGGVGVTPLRSMIREALLCKKPMELVLFYSEKNRSAMAYEREFRELAAAHSTFRFIPILTRESPEDWDGETCRLDRAMTERLLTDWTRGRYAVCGPDAFMDCVKTMLMDAGVDVATRFQKESFG
ncbi:MAG: FAD-binding oxidoreductase [Patescibacteria group bacterium]|jgi:ferredoxin-NADP reductase